MKYPRTVLAATLLLLIGSLASFSVISASDRSFIILGLALCVVLFAGILYRPMRWLSFTVTLGLLAGGYALLRPVCVLIPDEDLVNFSTPIEQRTDRSGYMPTFQKKDDGHWYQCKMAVDRWFFF